MIGIRPTFKLIHHMKHPRRERSGAILPLLAFGMIVIVILAAFAINIAYLELCRTEMYVASDSASRAAGREFTVSNSTEQARIRGKRAAELNTIAGKVLTLADGDFVFGQSNRNSLTSRYSFTPGGGHPNAVEVTVRRTNESANGPIPVLIPNPFEASGVNSTQTARANQTEVDIAIVLDRSGSMAFATDESSSDMRPRAAPPGWDFNGPAPNPSRWRDAVEAVREFLVELDKTAVSEIVSLSSYNHDVSVDQQLTSNYASIQSRLQNYTNHFVEGDTNIGGGIFAGLQTFASPGHRPYASKVMIVLTDGIDTMGSNPVFAAEEAAKQKIMVFTITFSNEADQATMKLVAEKGLGKHYHATSGSSLTEVFQDIAKQLPIILSK
jgi:Ca-activated chloride channel family protein